MCKVIRRMLMMISACGPGAEDGNRIKEKQIDAIILK